MSRSAYYLQQAEACERQAAVAKPKSSGQSFLSAAAQWRNWRQTPCRAKPSSKIQPTAPPLARTDTVAAMASEPPKTTRPEPTRRRQPTTPPLNSWRACTGRHARPAASRMRVLPIDRTSRRNRRKAASDLERIPSFWNHERIPFRTEV